MVQNLEGMGFTVVPFGQGYKDMAGYAVGRQNGWLSSNDIRELENLNRIPEDLGGDLFLINGAMTKLQDAGIFYVE